MIKKMETTVIYSALGVRKLQCDFVGQREAAEQWGPGEGWDTQGFQTCRNAEETTINKVCHCRRHETITIILNTNKACRHPARKSYESPREEKFSCIMFEPQDGNQIGPEERRSQRQWVALPESGSISLKVLYHKQSAMACISNFMIFLSTA